MASEMLDVRVWRGTAEGSFRSYPVPRQDSQTVLDVVTYIQRRLEPSLSYRFSCRVGHVRLLRHDGQRHRPLDLPHPRVQGAGRTGGSRSRRSSNLPVIKDLATDMREFFDKWARAKGQFRARRRRTTRSRGSKPASPERLAANAGIECIGCGVCYASCDVVSWRPDFLGPAALNRAWTLANDVRDVAQGERLAAVAGDAGCHACHSHGSCTERCPKQIEPTAGIAGLKRLAARAAIRGEL